MPLRQLRLSALLALVLLTMVAPLAMVQQATVEKARKWILPPTNVYVHLDTVDRLALFVTLIPSLLEVELLVPLVLKTSSLLPVLNPVACALLARPKIAVDSVLVAQLVKSPLLAACLA
jgi:hypothetical protein